MLLLPFITEDNYYSTKLTQTLAAIPPSGVKVWIEFVIEY